MLHTDQEKKLPIFYLKKLVSDQKRLRKQLSNYVGMKWDRHLPDKLVSDLNWLKLPSSTLFQTLLTWKHDGIFTVEEANTLSWWVAANRSKLRKKKVLIKPSCLLRFEWSLIQFRDVMAVNKYGAVYQFLILTGSMAGLCFNKDFTPSQ